MVPMVLVRFPLRTGLLLSRGPEEQETYRRAFLINMRMLRSTGQGPGLDALLQWVGELWWGGGGTADMKAEGLINVTCITILAEENPPGHRPNPHT